MAVTPLGRSIQTRALLLKEAIVSGARFYPAVAQKLTTNTRLRIEERGSPVVSTYIAIGFVPKKEREEVESESTR